MDESNSWKVKVMVIGAVAGVLFGLAAAMIVIERAERENVQPSISPGDGVKLGLGVLGLMRLIADLGDKQ